jgi:hypothetical protein
MKVACCFRYIMSEFVNKDVINDEDVDFYIKDKVSREEQKVCSYFTTQNIW